MEANASNKLYTTPASAATSTEMSPKGGRKVHFLAERRMQAEHPIEKVGAELRSMMSWLKK